MRIRWDRVGRVGLLIVLALVAALYVQNALSFLSAHAQASQQRAVVSSLVRANRQLASQQRALNDPAVIVQRARALGMVRPGERPYVITGLPNR